MKLTYKTEYALLALIYLARNKQAKNILAQEVADKQGIPKKFLQQIFNQLKKAQYVNANRGKGGGYQLSKAPEDISIAEIVRLFDGPLAPTTAASKFFYSSAPIEKEPKALSLFCEIREFLAQKLEHTMLSELT